MGFLRPLGGLTTIQQIAARNATRFFRRADAKPSETNFDGDRKIQWAQRPLREVFASTKLTIKEGETPAPLEIRALPTVVIEGRWVDSKGRPGWGWSPLVVGKMDGSSWIAEAHVGPLGRFSLKVPHGLEKATLTIMAGEHASTRYRIGNAGPLVESPWVDLGTLDHDVKGFEIVRYVGADHRHQRHHEGRPADQGFPGGRPVHPPRPA